MLSLCFCFQISLTNWSCFAGSKIPEQQDWWAVQAFLNFLWGSACGKGGANLFVSWPSSCQTRATSASPDWSTMLGGLIGAEIESAATQGETILRLRWPVVYPSGFAPQCFPCVMPTGCPTYFSLWFPLNFLTFPNKDAEGNQKVSSIGVLNTIYVTV